MMTPEERRAAIKMATGSPQFAIVKRLTVHIDAQEKLLRECRKGLLHAPNCESNNHANRQRNTCTCGQGELVERIKAFLGD